MSKLRLMSILIFLCALPATACPGGPGMLRNASLFDQVTWMCMVVAILGGPVIGAVALCGAILDAVRGARPVPVK